MTQPHDRAKETPKPQMAITYHEYVTSLRLRITRPAMPAMMSKMTSAPFGMSTTSVPVCLYVMHAGLSGDTAVTGTPAEVLPADSGRTHSLPVFLTDQNFGMHRYSIRFVSMGLIQQFATTSLHAELISASERIPMPGMPATSPTPLLHISA